MNEAERELGRLFAERDGMSVVEKDALFESIWEQTSSADTTEASVHTLPLPETQGTSSWRPMAPAFLIAAILLLGVGLGPILRGAPPQNGMQARGAMAAAHQLELVCTAYGVRGACTRDSVLSFRASSQRASHLALFAKHASSGRVIWYLPAHAEETSGLLGANDEMLPTSIALSSKHAPGSYEVFGLFSTRPLTQAEIKQSFGASDPKDHPDVVVRSMELP